jgi:DNA-binding response OmpR family regulator
VAGSRVLVVDDDEIVRFLLQRILNQAGFEVDLAGDGREGLDAFAARRPDLVLLDLMMPDLDGWTVLARMKEAPDPPPVVIVTAHGERAAQTRALRQGAAAYVTKPFTVRDLVALCRRLTPA